ncbi:MAG: transposase [Opitutales bacterium]|nr:transposase [Opitutales bacterium]
MSKYTQRPMVNEEVCVHAMSRVIQKRFLIDEPGMEEMRRILRTQAEFAGMEVITFCFLKNHFHILLHVDPEQACENVTDEELLRRFRALYGSKRSPSLGADAETLEALLKRNDERAQTARKRLKARMGDVSVFMRELKTRFTFWYNEHYKTVGTFWAERFRSVLVEPGSLALKAVAAYIDLNAVRAGLTDSPQHYRYCGLGEANLKNPIGRRAQTAYEWLHRRKKGRKLAQSLEASTFEDYEAYVNRILEQIHREQEALAITKSRASNEMTVEESAATLSYNTNAGAVGSATWIERICAADGVFGFLHRRKRPAILLDPDVEIHAARHGRTHG